MATSRRKALLVKRGKQAATGIYRSGATSTFVTTKDASPAPRTAVFRTKALVVETSTLLRVLSEERSIAALGSAMASNPEPVSPELARSLQAEENWWRKIERELPSLTSAEAAELLGAKPTNRNFASSQRAAGKLLGYTRRHAARFPKFQFDLAKGSVLPVIPQLIAVARDLETTDEDLVLWLAAPSSMFAEQDRPADHLNDPDRLLAAARTEFGAIW
ncbi:hypothetical protein [Arthrobacter sp. CG_A4]|uniref:hypothetical protein n=1 Tax=Arthrobacter sp. CG_A4 TaxID=3071706 RepID=UPI002E0C449D|nr:hypothetical protein [Arthrobacter sp. CG_A4]